MADTIFGSVVADPYRWMEDVSSDETRHWIVRQDSVARAFASAWGGRDSARQMMLRRTIPTATRAPTLEGGRFFTSWTRGSGPSLSFSVLMRERADTPDRVIMDDDSLRTHEHLHLRAAVPSPDGRLLAYSVSGEQTLNWQTRIRDIDAGRDLPDRLTDVDGAQGPGSLVWARRGAAGFFYTRLVQIERSATTGRRTRPQIRFHSLGSTVEDPVVFETPDHADWLFSSRVSDDGRFLVVRISQGVSRQNRIYVANLSVGMRPRPFIDEGDAEFIYVGNRGATLWFQTNLGAPNGRIVAIDVARPERGAWKTVVAETKNAIDSWIGAFAVGEKLLVTYRADAVLTAKLIDPVGSSMKTVAFPQPFNSMWAASGRAGQREAFVVLQGVADPGTTYALDTERGTLRVFSRPALPYDPDEFVTEQRFAQSRDGTRIPMYIVHHRSTKLDGSAPGIIYGYGFNAWPGSPWFQPMITEWMREGGVWALANVRGGGEYGLPWYEAGRRRNKQNSIDDYIAASEWLKRNHYVSAGKLVANSSSAGGVVAAAAITQRPELYAAGVLDYPVLDMLRYHLTPGGARWVGEYGTVRDSADFVALRGYAPIQKASAGTCYPPVLAAPGEVDPLAAPMQAYKLIAALQYANASTGNCANPELLRVSWRAGHSAGATTEDQIDTWVDELAFIWRSLADGIVRRDTLYEVLHRAAPLVIVKHEHNSCFVDHSAGWVRARPISCHR